MANSKISLIIQQKSDKIVLKKYDIHKNANKFPDRERNEILKCTARTAMNATFFFPLFFPRPFRDLFFGSGMAVTTHARRAYYSLIFY